MFNLNVDTAKGSVKPATSSGRCRRRRAASSIAGKQATDDRVENARSCTGQIPMANRATSIRPSQAVIGYRIRVPTTRKALIIAT